MKKVLLIGICIISLILISGCDYLKENEVPCWRQYSFDEHNTIVISGYLVNQTGRSNGEIMFTEELCCTKQNGNSIVCIK